MSRGLRRFINYTAILSLSFLFLVGCQSNQDKSEQNHPSIEGVSDLSGYNLQVSDFSFTNQDGNEYGWENVKGKLWLTNFIFTSCTTVCPPMTANMANIQQELHKEGLDIPIISFSVDPEVDTPEALKQYGERYQADFTQWNFLTGYKQEEIKEIAAKSFKTVVEDDPNSNQVTHGTSFYLVDQKGQVVRKYDGLTPPVGAIIEDVKKFSH